MVLLLFLGMIALPGMSNAQGIEDGESMLSLYGGLGSAMQSSGVEMDGRDLSWGNFGGELGLSYLYFPSAYLGIGADLRYAGFQGSDTVEDVPGYWYWHTFESDFETHSLQLMAAGRINVNPGSAVGLYIPFGGGAVLANETMTYTWDDSYEWKESSSQVSFGWYAGVGLEFAQNDRSAWSLEARYNTFRYDNSDFARQIGGFATGGNSQRSYVSVVASVRFK